MRHRCRIFIVDDEASVRRALARTLEHSDWEVHCFENPLQARERIEELRPRVVVSDYSMPEMTGFDFLVEVRRKFPQIRTMLLSATAHGALGEEAVSRGVVDRMMSKPWSDDELRRTIRELIEA